MSGDLRVVSDGEELSRVAAREILRIGAAAIEARGRFLVALSGGTTPRGTYERLAAGTNALDWSATSVFWSDERCVPAEHPESNYRMAREALLGSVPIPEDHVFRVRTELAPPLAASEYHDRIATVVLRGPDHWPRFDLVLLGMGADGHVASLFPGTKALDETDQFAAASYVDSISSWRITLTLPVLNHAEHAIVLVSGREKADALRRAIKRQPARHQPPLPAERLHPEIGTLLWIADQEAAWWRD